MSESETTTTPGPWSFGKIAKDPRDLGMILAPGGKVVCYFGNDRTNDCEPGTPPSAPDLALILAAPQMAEEIKRLKEQITDLEDALSVYRDREHKKPPIPYMLP